MGIALVASTEHESSTRTAPKQEPDKGRPASNRQPAAPDLERERREAERQAMEILDQEAIAAIHETRSAVEAIAANKTDEALQAIERATGKVDILAARNPAAALVAVDLEAKVIDTAPRDSIDILEIAQDASLAVDELNFPDARALLHALMSEVRVRIYNLPLATYPTALKDAARLLEQRKSDGARSILLAALTTLVAIDQVTPIPLILARDAIKEAQAQLNNTAEALKLLETARNELVRARQLGYAGKAPEYGSLHEDISKLEKQLRSKEDTGPGFARLREKLASFLKLQSQQKQR
jgi:hypothetical protein